MGTINLESLKVIVYHDDTATSRAHIAPSQAVHFLLFFFIVATSKVMYLSLDEINISLYGIAVNRKRYKYISFLLMFIFRKISTLI